MFSRIVDVIVTNEVPVAILLAYIVLPRHIPKGELIRRVIGCRQFLKESRNAKRELCLNVVIHFFLSLSVVLPLRDVPKTVF